jgi:hypothetical protein
MLIHEALLDAVHVHVLVVDTCTVPEPPATGNESFLGEIENEHAEGEGGGVGGGEGGGGDGVSAPACLIVDRWSATTIAPFRAPP